MPDFIGIDKDNFINAMEDLGQAQDLSYLYQRQEPIAKGEIEKLCGYLSILHNEYRIEQGVSGLSNLALRKLNHEHIFIYPFLDDNGFSLDDIQSGLQACALKYKKSDALKEVATVLGEKYLSDGIHLVHGDFYPGSWVKAKKQLYVIDPEFCHYGAPEFDLGVMQAHMHLSGNESKLDQIMDIYKKPANFDEKLCNNYKGIEILRRIIGLAQLPLHLSIEEKEALLQMACKNLEVEI
jgi:5-methylthioribose kinase